MPGASPPAPEPREARDVIAFGQEVGRVLSDGRIVGRAEPFAKVFPSSRAVKRAVGLMAWGILEDIALDARIDDLGRLVAETSVRRIAGHLQVSKNTVTKYLGRLREHGFVFQEESREVDSGRWEACRYVLDPSACIERFTHTPTQNGRSDPCPKSWDTAAESVPQDTGHRDAGHRDVGHLKEVVVEDLAVQNQEQQQRMHAREDTPPTGNPSGNGSGHPPGDSAAAAASGSGAGEAGNGVDGNGTSVLAGRLQRAGIAGDVAEGLVGRYPHERIDQALAAAEHRRPDNPPGWIVAALDRDWDLSTFLAHERANEARRENENAQDAALEQRRREQAQQRDRSAGWSAAVSAGLDDAQLAEAVDGVTTPMAGLQRRSVPLARAQLIAWAVAVHAAHPDQALAQALAADLQAASPTPPEIDGDELPVAPRTGHPPDLSARIALCLQHQEAERDPPDRDATRTAPPTRQQPDHGLEL